MAKQSRLIFSTQSALAAAASVTASALLIRSVTNDLLPSELHDYIMSAAGRLRESMSSQVTVIINEKDGAATNDIFNAAITYLGARMAPSTRRLTASYQEGDKSFKFNVDQGTEVVDVFIGISFMWKLVYRQTNNAGFPFNNYGQLLRTAETKSLELSFHKKHKDSLSQYLSHVMEQFMMIKEKDKTLKLYMNERDRWTPINLHHPATFDKLAMDPELKKEIMDDLMRFVKRREYYKKIGKAWKRGYLLYGPPGTGKSSLVAAMANFLNFNIYDLEITEVSANWELRRLLVGTANRSIIVVEDVDCSAELLSRESAEHVNNKMRNNNHSNDTVTLSGFLNLVDGLWSSCGDERIIIFTTNYKDRLDPALLRPGRMDMHIYMGYCSASAFRALVRNYHDVDEHALFDEIEQIIGEVSITPAEVAEELLKNDDVDSVLQRLLYHLQQKREEEKERKEAATKEEEIKDRKHENEAMRVHH